ncbi:unnamed protein product, partial [Prorocentrum cordatum]
EILSGDQGSGRLEHLQPGGLTTRGRGLTTGRALGGSLCAPLAAAAGHPHGAAGGLQGPPHRRGGPVSGFVADDGLVVRARQPLGREEERLPAGGPGGAGGPCQAAFQRGGPPNRALEDAHRPVQADGGFRVSGRGRRQMGRRPRSAATCVDGRRGLGARARCRAGDPARSVRARRPRPRAPVLVRTWRSGAP